MNPDTHPGISELTLQTSAVTLQAGALRLALRPDLGGAVAGFWLDGTSVLCSTDPEALTSARASGLFALLPYSNRIAGGRFSWQGEEVNLAMTLPHAMHGIGHLRPWRVVSQDSQYALLQLDHPGDDEWPFAFSARQHFMLRPEGLWLELAVTSHHDDLAPMGLGWHPWFPKRRGSRLLAPVLGRWESDAERLPLQHVACGPIDARISALALDHGHTGWSGTALIDDHRLALTLRSSLPQLVVCTPPDKDNFAVEPVSHAINALNLSEPDQHGMACLAPGQSLPARMSITVRRAAAQ